MSLFTAHITGSVNQRIFNLLIFYLLNMSNSLKFSERSKEFVFQVQLPSVFYFLEELRTYSLSNVSIEIEGLRY